MSRVAHEFWNHKRIAQAEARQRLKALGILTGDEVQKPLIVDVLEQKIKDAEKATRELLTKSLWAPGR